MSQLTIKELTNIIHQNAVDHGWWEQKRNVPEIVALIHSEVSEVLEEYRNGKELTETYYSGSLKEFSTETIVVSKVPCLMTNFKNSDIECRKPEGIPAELADIVIRVMDFCGYAGIDLESAIIQKHEYNVTRPYKHGGKKT